MLTRQAAHALLDQLAGQKCDFADVYDEQVTETTIRVQDKQLKTCQTGVTQGISLRVIDGLKTRHAYTNSTKKADWHQLVSELNLSDHVRRGTRHIRIKQEKSHLPYSVATPRDKTDHQDIIALCHELSDNTLAHDQRIQQVVLSYHDRERLVRICNTDGKDIREILKILTLSISITAKDNHDCFTSSEIISRLGGQDIVCDSDLKPIVHDTVERALRHFGAKSPKGGVLPVVLSGSAGGTIIHEAVGHGLEGDLVIEGMSLFRGKIGQLIAHPKVTIVDDATIPNLRGSFSFDDEGTPSQSNVLIENGVLKTYLCDRLSASRLGIPPTGNGRRESFEHPPLTRMTNLFLSSGTDKTDNIIASVADGLFVTKMGGGQVNPVSGDFMFRVQEAFEIKHGKIGTPLKNVTLTGNGPEMMKHITMMSGDPSFVP
ncbi:MAG TPA: TldD/PmbA family protein, partial [bacterium]|nr:TldD/PmbA family protein [bacterium]